MKKGLFVVITMVLLALAWQLSYKEDIQDFLPFGKTDRQRMAVYQDISGMNRLFVIFTAPCSLPPAPCPFHCQRPSRTLPLAFGESAAVAASASLLQHLQACPGPHHPR